MRRHIVRPQIGDKLGDIVGLVGANAELRYLVLPMRPAGTEGWSEERLAACVTRDAMIGTAIVDPPR
jgi:hypothetical protein